MQVTDWLHRAAEHHPDRIALEDRGNGRTYSYAEFNLRASRLARYFRDELRLVPGSRIAILSHNRAEYLEALHACAKSGMVLVCLNWRLATPELLVIAADCAPALVIFEPDFAGPAHAILSAHPGCGALPLDAEAGYEAALTQTGGGAIEMESRDAGEIWHLLYTSGTTGRPKGVIQTYGMVLVNAMNTLVAGKVAPGDVFLNVLPFFHTGGLNLYASPVLMTGGTVVIMRRFEAGEALSLLGRGVTSFFGVPAIYLQLAAHPDFAAADLSRMRNFSVGGAPIPTAIGAAFADKGATVAPSYGMTEVGPTVFAADCATAAAKPLSVGKPVGQARIRIVDRRWQDVAPGERGELLLGGPVVTPGYWNMPETTALTIRDGWLRSGDIAYRDGDGDVFIVDRLKDMYISGGENVYPAEVEEVLHALPAVAEAAVIGVPDSRWGEVGLAVLVPAQGAVIAEDEVVQYCRERLAGYKVPRHVRVAAALPRTPSGKVEKHKLAADYRPRLG